MKTAFHVLAYAALAAAAAQVTVTETMTVMVQATSASNPSNGNAGASPNGGKNGASAEMPLGSQSITDGDPKGGKDGDSSLAGSSGSLGGSGVTNPSGEKGGEKGGSNSNNEPMSSASSASSASSSSATESSSSSSSAASSAAAPGTLTAQITSGSMAAAGVAFTEQVEGPSQAPSASSAAKINSDPRPNGNAFLDGASRAATAPALGMSILPNAAGLPTGALDPSPMAAGSGSPAKPTAAALSMNVEGTNKPTEPMVDATGAGAMPLASTSPSAIGSSSAGESVAFAKGELFTAVAGAAILGAALVL